MSEEFTKNGRASSRQLESNVRRVEISPAMAAEVVSYPGAACHSVNFRMLQVRLGNRTLWTWSRMQPSQARALAEALLAAAEEAEG